MTFRSSKLSEANETIMHASPKMKPIAKHYQYRGADYSLASYWVPLHPKANTRTYSKA